MLDLGGDVGVDYVGKWAYVSGPGGDIVRFDADDCLAFAEAADREQLGWIVGHWAWGHGNGSLTVLWPGVALNKVKLTLPMLLKVLNNFPLRSRG